MVAEPGRFTDVGLNDAVAPAGSPLALRLTVPVRPRVGAMAAVKLVLPPWGTVCLAGVTDSEKSGVAGALKKTPLTRALAPPVRVMRMITWPLRFHSIHTPLPNDDTLRVSSSNPLPASRMSMVSDRPPSQSRQ